MSRSGFSFLSSQRITPLITYAVNGSATFRDAQEVTEVVPEPATSGFMLLTVGVFGIHRLLNYGGIK